MTILPSSLPLSKTPKSTHPTPHLLKNGREQRVLSKKLTEAKNFQNHTTTQSHPRATIFFIFEVHFVYLFFPSFSRSRKLKFSVCIKTKASFYTYQKLYFLEYKKLSFYIFQKFEFSICIKTIRIQIFGIYKNSVFILRKRFPKYKNWIFI